MKITLLCGNVGSGKSTYAFEFCRANPNTIRINADKMRYIVTGDESNMKCDGAVWASLERMAEYLLDSGFSLIIDNLNYHKKARKFWIGLAKKYFLKIDCVIINTPYDICIDRNKSRSRIVPEFVLEKVKNGWEEPTVEEGFNQILKI